MSQSENKNIPEVEPSQWAIAETYTPMKINSLWSFDDCKKYFQQYEGINPIHVIVYSAYEEVAEKYMALSDKYVTRVNEVIELKEENKHLNIYTCHTCSDKKTCQYAYDAYNTNDDCLAIK